MEQEARTNILRCKARSVYDGRDNTEEELIPSGSQKNEHVNFFKELEEGLVSFTGTNKEYEKEKKEEKEKYEKQIGYLTYLGQDTVESTGNISWYNKIPRRLDSGEKRKEEARENEVNIKSKLLVDPLNSIRRYIGIHSASKKADEKKDVVQVKKKYVSIEQKQKRKRVESSGSEEEKRKHKKKRSKKRKRSCSTDNSLKKKHTKSTSVEIEEPDSTSKTSLEVLRAKRLQREKEEKLRAARHLAKLRGETLPEDKPVAPTIEQKYSSQFNPHLAKQNFSSERSRKH